MSTRPIEAALLAFSPARRGFCPSRNDLVQHFDGALSAAQQALVAAHVAACPFCASDLADLNALAAPPLIEAAVALVAGGLRLLSHSFANDELLAPQPARSAGTVAASPSVVELQTTDAGRELQLQVRHNAGSAPDLRIQVANPQGRRIRVSLYRREALLESLVSTSGEVVFAAVEPGDYRICAATLQGEELAPVRLRLIDERHAG